MSGREVRTAGPRQASDEGYGDVRGLRTSLVFALLSALVLLAFVANLLVGSVALEPRQILSILAGATDDQMAYQVIWSIRLPRICAAALLGGALGLSGMLLQTLFANPIAGPYVLGISNGAKLAVALVMVVIVGDLQAMSTWMQLAAAFVGSFAVMAFVLAVSRRVSSSSVLVVVGVMVGYVCNAVTDVLITFASDANIVNLRNWSLGSFSGTSGSQVLAMAVVVLTAFALTYLLAKPLGIYQLGETYAESMGVDVRTFRLVVIVLASVLAASVTAFAGPISFVGVAVPHVARHLLGTSRPQLVIPASFLSGSLVCLVCDLVARAAFAPVELPVSTVTALFGAPVVIWVLLSRHERVS